MMAAFLVSALFLRVAALQDASQQDQSLIRQSGKPLHVPEVRQDTINGVKPMTPEDEVGEGGSQLELYVIMGSVIGLLTLGVLVGACVCFYRRRRTVGRPCDAATEPNARCDPALSALLTGGVVSPTLALSSRSWVHNHDIVTTHPSGKLPDS